MTPVKTLLMALLLACLLITSASAAAPQKISVGYVPNNAFAPLFVIKGEGWDKEAGLDLQPQRFPSAAVGMQAFAQGHVDVLYSITSVVLNAAATGIDLRILYAGLKEGDHLYGHGKLADLWHLGAKRACAEFTKQADRKPRFVAFFRGNMTDVVLRYYLKQQGISESDVEITNIPGQDQFQQALLSGQYDAMCSFEPLLTITQDKGLPIRKLVDAHELMPEHTVVSIVTTPQFIAQNRAALLSLGRLHRRAVDLIQQSPRRAAPHISKFVGENLIPLSLIERVLPAEGKDFTYNLPSMLGPLQLLHDVMREQGLLKAPVDLKRLVDSSLDDELNKEAKR